MELANKIKEQAIRSGTNILEFKEVKTIEPSGKRVKAKTDEEKYNTYAAIIASGSIPKKLNVPGEEKYSGKGVSYCATCDWPLYRNRDKENWD